MWAEFIHTLRSMRGQVIGWSIGLALYVLFMVSFYDDLNQIEGFQEILESYPQEMLAFFGDFQILTTPRGYLDTYFFSYMPLIIGIFAIGVGAGLLVSDEEKGILDLVMAHPVSRTMLYWGRVLAYLAATILILLVSWLTWVLPSGSSGMDLTWQEFLRPFLPLFGALTLFGALAILLSLLLPSGRMAGMISGALLVANFLLLGLARLNEDLEAIVQYTPLYYNQGGDAVEMLNWGEFAGLLAVAAVLAILGWRLFLRRDIRVGGERSWRLPRLRRAHAT
jgi:ABC-2 type transport system permease protein